MPQGRQIEVPLFSKAPFSNYDLVVYLGGGFFALFLLWRYIVGPADMFDLTDLTSTDSNDSWTKQLIYLLVLTILSYTIGHLVSYLSSHFVEGFLNKTLGSFSEVIKLSTKDREDFEREFVRAIAENKRENFGWSSNWLIWLAHAPFALWYWAFVQFKMFNCLDTRIPKRMFDSLNPKLDRFFDDVSTRQKRQWFRWIEYYTSYNAPVASASMYNYLVISGFMRSISFLLLLSAWLEVAHLFCFAFTGKPKIHVDQGWPEWLAYAVVIFVGYVCALTAYIKFYRRYVEEAILGFLLEVPRAPSTSPSTTQ